MYRKSFSKSCNNRFGYENIAFQIFFTTVYRAKTQLLLSLSLPEKLNLDAQREVATSETSKSSMHKNVTERTSCFLVPIPKLDWCLLSATQCPSFHCRNWEIQDHIHSKKTYHSYIVLENTENWSLPCKCWISLRLIWCKHGHFFNFSSFGGFVGRKKISQAKNFLQHSPHTHYLDVHKPNWVQSSVGDTKFT